MPVKDVFLADDIHTPSVFMCVSLSKYQDNWSIVVSSSHKSIINTQIANYVNNKIYIAMLRISSNLLWRKTSACCRKHKSLKESFNKSYRKNNRTEYIHRSSGLCLYYPIIFLLPYYLYPEGKTKKKHAIYVALEF